MLDKYISKYYDKSYYFMGLDEDQENSETNVNRVSTHLEVSKHINA